VGALLSTTNALIQRHVIMFFSRCSVGLHQSVGSYCNRSMNSPQKYSGAPNIDYMLIHVVYHCFNHSGQGLKQQHAGVNAEPCLRKLIDALLILIVQVLKQASLH